MARIWGRRPRKSACLVAGSKGIISSPEAGNKAVPPQA